MAAAAELAQVPDVDIDTDGTFKYVLVRVCGPGGKKDIVRGWSWAEYHGDIFDKVVDQLEKMGMKCDCKGGGRIQHDSQDKTINVYGYSVGFGRAKHEITTEKLKVKYPDYSISWSNEGY